MGIIKEFKEFAVKGNVIDMAVGIIIGGAFGTIAKTLVSEVIMPPIGILLGGFDLTDWFITIKEGSVAAPYLTLQAAKEAGAVTMNLGLLLNAVISFLIVAFVVFILIKQINRLKSEAEEAPAKTKPCDFCKSDIAIEAVRCPQCTSELSNVAAE